MEPPSSLLFFVFVLSFFASVMPSLPALAHELHPSLDHRPPLPRSNFVTADRSALHRFVAYAIRRLVEHKADNSSGFDPQADVMAVLRSARLGEDKTKKKGNTHDIPGTDNGTESTVNDDQRLAPAPAPLASNHTNTTKDMNPTHTADETAFEKTTNGTKDPENACEGGSYCQADKLCLRTSRDGMHTLSLSITNEGDNSINVTVVALGFHKELMVKNGTNETVHFSKDMERIMSGAKSMNVTISIGHECQIEVPIDHVDKYPSISIPMAGVFMLVAVLFMVAVIWLFCRYRRRKRAGDGVKYQELVQGVRTPKEEESTDGWNEIWDDDWEDTEAARSSSRIVKNLSSRGLAARRGNKDEWDHTWDD